MSVARVLSSPFYSFDGARNPSDQAHEYSIIYLRITVFGCRCVTPGPEPGIGLVPGRETTERCSELVPRSRPDSILATGLVTPATTSRANREDSTDSQFRESGSERPEIGTCIEADHLMFLLDASRRSQPCLCWRTHGSRRHIGKARFGSGALWNDKEESGKVAGHLTGATEEYCKEYAAWLKARGDWSEFVQSIAGEKRARLICTRMFADRRLTERRSSSSRRSSCCTLFATPF